RQSAGCNPVAPNVQQWLARRAETEPGTQGSSSDTSLPNAFGLKRSFVRRSSSVPHHRGPRQTSRRHDLLPLGGPRHSWCYQTTSPSAQRRLRQEVTDASATPAVLSRGTRDMRAEILSPGLTQVEGFIPAHHGLCTEASLDLVTGNRSVRRPRGGILES